MMKITTYEELNKYVKAFSNDNFNLLIIKSKGGLSKSQLLKQYAKDSIFFRGHATPLSIFLKLQENSRRKVIFDDVDELIKNKGNISILKQLTETTKIKEVQYNTTSQAMQPDKQSFMSRNKICLLVNDIKRIGHNMQALLTRGFYIDFCPSNQEIMNKLKELNEIMRGFGFANDISLKNNTFEIEIGAYKPASFLLIN